MVRVKLVLVWLLVFTIAGCQSAAVETTSEVDQSAKVESLRALGVIGSVESVVIYPQKIVYDARIDTGATTSSMDARDVVMFERDRNKWVRFFIVDREDGKRYEIERPIVRTSKITRHGQKAEERQVVELTISMGNVVLVREFSLADRENFEYAVLIGRNVLQGKAVVDVALSKTLPVEFVNE